MVDYRSRSPSLAVISSGFRSPLAPPASPSSAAVEVATASLRTMNRRRTLILFEDAAVRGLSPLCDLRPAFELRVGSLNLRERLEIAAPGHVRRAVAREELGALLQASLVEWAEPLPRGEEPVLLLNARLRASVKDLRSWCARSEDRAVAKVGEAVAWASCRAEEARAFLGQGASLPADLVPIELDPPPILYRHIWELVHDNGPALCVDFRELDGVEIPQRRVFGVNFMEESSSVALLGPVHYADRSRAIVYPGVHVIEEDNVRYAPGARVRPGVVLDAEEGPILLGPGCTIQPNVVIQGPAFVGPGCTVNPGAKLREGTSLGALCKVGGEIEESVLLDLSNKQHDGFLGHAYLGSWVNLGADTNGSDLKNNYSEVRVDLGEGSIATGQRFVGPMVGDPA